MISYMKYAAEIILYDDEKQILLQHRTDDAPTYPNYYGLFGGSIEKNETPEDAIIRECFEKLEYPLKKPKLILNIICDSIYGEKRNKYVFMEKYDQTQKLILHEGQGMIWVKFDEIKKFNIIPHDLEVFKKITFPLG